MGLFLIHSSNQTSQSLIHLVSNTSTVCTNRLRNTKRKFSNMYLTVWSDSEMHLHVGSKISKKNNKHDCVNNNLVHCFSLFKNLFIYNPYVDSMIPPPTIPYPNHSSSVSKRVLPYHQALLHPGGTNLMRSQCSFSHWGQTRQSTTIYVLEA